MSPEEMFVLGCLHSFLTGASLPVADSLDWNEFYQIAAVNKIVPIIASVLSTSPQEDAVLVQFKESARRARMRAALMLDEFQRIQLAFQEAGVAVIPFKGIALSQTVYPSPSMRYFDDLDLLIRLDSSELALAQLQILGYEPHPNAPRPEWHHLPPHINRNRGTMVELHFDLIRRSRRGWDVQGIWDRSIEALLGGVNTKFLSPIDSLITTALHARHNLYHRLSALVDIALQLSEGSILEQDQAALSNLISGAGASCALAYSTQSANRLFDLDLVQLGRCGRSQSWFSYRIGGWKNLAPKSASFKQGPLPRVMEAFLMDSLKDSLALLGKLALPPRSFVAPKSDTIPMRSYASRLVQRVNQFAAQTRRLLRDR